MYLCRFVMHYVRRSEFMLCRCVYTIDPSHVNFDCIDEVEHVIKTQVRMCLTIHGPV
jgi:hypothetical protein